jgi:hypothetical protein
MCQFVSSRRLTYRGKKGLRLEISEVWRPEGDLDRRSDVGLHPQPLIKIQWKDSVSIIDEVARVKGGHPSHCLIKSWPLD